MKARLLFDLSDHEDQMDFRRCSQSVEMACVLFDLRNIAFKKDITNEEFF